MKENFYPESEEILFTNREGELKTLDFYLEEFLNGIKENVCIFGLDRYYIADKVFKMWLDLRKTGELGESPKDKAVEIYLKILERKYLKAKTELGKAKESEIREKLKGKFGIEFKPYLDKDI